MEGSTRLRHGRLKTPPVGFSVVMSILLLIFANCHPRESNLFADVLFHQRLATYRSQVQKLLERKRVENCVMKVPWYHIKLGGRWTGGHNFGDDMNLDLASAVLKIRREEVWSTTRRSFDGKVLAIGSTLTHSMPNDMVFGTGLAVSSPDAAPESRLWKRLTHTRIYSLRGPISARAIARFGLSSPKSYGDLGITASILIWPDLQYRKEATHDVCVIPHATDETLKLESYERNLTVFSISPEFPKYLTERMLTCSRVISSSLHALMIAQAYNIPAFWYSGPDSPKIDKFLDYFLGVGIVGVTRYSSLEEALHLKSERVPVLDPAVMFNIAKQFINTFPFDKVCY